MNLRSGIGWKFPPLNGGEGQGFEHAGMAHFQGNLLGSLAREIIQNSLDARRDDAKPVDVTFELQSIDVHRHLGGDELRRHLLACAEVATDGKAERFFRDAAALLDRDAVQFLRVSDGNTTGLGEKQWRALVKMQGEGAKRDATAGGSFGIGKNAPFAVSPLRTVGYWSYSTADGGIVEKFQAKAILMSHPWVEEGQNRTTETQAVGFYGDTTTCREMCPPRIPSVFRRLNHRRQPIEGTTVWISGFHTNGEWRRQITQSVLRNYFYAIDRGRLEILIEPDDSQDASPTSLDRDSLKKVFDYFMTGTAPDTGLSDAHRYWSVQSGAPPTFDEELSGLGSVKLWIEVGEDLPRKVALIRGTGMLITDRQPGLMRFRDLRDFAAVCVFESDEANELLRTMENPAHDRFEPDRLPEQDRKRGREALERVVKWIREKLKEEAALPRPEGGVDLVELRRFLPDLDAPGPLAGSSNNNNGREKAFGEPGAVLRRAPKRRVQPGPLPTEAEEEDGTGDGAGHEGGAPTNLTGHGGGDGSGGSGDGDGQGGTGSRGGGAGRAALTMRDVRVLAVDGDDSRVRVVFTPEATGRVRLSLEKAGDSTALPISGVRLFDDDDREITKEAVEIEAGARMSVFASADQPLVGAALRLTATDATEDPAT